MIRPMKLKLLIAAGLGALTLGAGPAPKVQPQAAHTDGYLGAAGPDTQRILPPAPVAGTTRYEADRTVFLATRSLKDTPRWAMAQADIDESRILKGLSCAIGVELTPQNAPKTTALLGKARWDVRRAVNRPKDYYKRQRPFMIDEGPICDEPHREELKSSPDYPSGHNSWGWTVGLVMAELVPDRASDILVRARAFGESRLVCGVHNLSAVEAGRLNGSAIVTALHGSPQFRSDMAAAAKEIAAVRKNAAAPNPQACAAEAALTVKPLY